MQPEEEVDVAFPSKYAHLRVKCVSDYRTGRAAYCDRLLSTHRTVVEAFSGKHVEVAKQSIFLTSHDSSGERPRLEGVRRVRDVVSLLAEPSTKRVMGFHGTEPVQMRAGSVHQAQREWLLCNVFYKLTARLRAADDEGSVPLVPLLLRPATLAQFIEANVKRVHQLIEEGGMLREILGLATARFGGGGERAARARELLQQALDMCALVVVVEYAPQDDVASGTMAQILEAFVLKELVHSGQRFVLVASSDVALPLPEAATLSMDGFGLNMREWTRVDTTTIAERDNGGMLTPKGAPPLTPKGGALTPKGAPEGGAPLTPKGALAGELPLTPKAVPQGEKKLEAAKLVTEIHSSRVGRMVTALHLGSNALEAEEAAGLARAASEWLRAPSCVLTSLDLSYTELRAEDWETLCFAFGRNASLTYLDMRAWPPVEDAVLDELGRSLLDAASPFGLRFARTNAFELVEGMAKLNLDETAMGPGAICMLAGVLKHNVTLRELHLCAAGVGSEGAVALATALRANSGLSTLRLLHNPLEEAGLAQIEEAVAFRVSTGHPLAADLTEG